MSVGNEESVELGGAAGAAVSGGGAVAVVQAMEPDEALPRQETGWAARLLPWAVSLTIVTWLLWPYRAGEGRAMLVDAFARASGWTFAVALLGAVAVWLTDAYATARTFQRWETPLSFREASLIRGATALFDAINPALGQAVLAMVVYRRGTSLSHTLVVVLLMNLVFLVHIALMSGLGLLAGAAPQSSFVPVVVLVSLGITAAYLLVVALRPAFLAKNATMAWLMDAGLRGHFWAFMYRLPNMLVLVGTQVLFMRCFGIDLPLDAALFYLPPVMFIVGMPISVQGLGPGQVASVEFFSAYVGAEPAVAEATVLACAFASTALATLSAVLIGLCCMSTQTGRTSLAAVRGR